MAPWHLPATITGDRLFEVALNQCSRALRHSTQSLQRDSVGAQDPEHPSNAEEICNYDCLQSTTKGAAV